MSELSMEIGKKIRYFRTGKNKTLEELAAAVPSARAKRRFPSTKKGIS